MIKITPLMPQQVADAKYIISAVAQRIFLPGITPQEFYDILEKENELYDIDQYQKVYEENKGLFLIVNDDERVVGTGALKRMDEHTAELKRLWLLEEYHGRKIGYQLVTRLLQFARANGYACIRLQTSESQTRAIEFYKRLGFYEIESYHASMDNVSMEMKL